MGSGGYLDALLSLAQFVCLLLFFLFLLFLAYVFWPHPQMRGADMFGEDVRREYARVYAVAPDTLKQRIHRTNQITQWLLFTCTGWDRWLNERQSLPAGRTTLFFDQFPLALRHASRLFSLRLALLWEHAVWFGLILILAGVDGWAGWIHRRHTGGMESAFICRHAGLAIALVACGLLLIYPLVPWPVSHRVVFTVSVVCLGLAMRWFICYFRKYV